MKLSKESSLSGISILNQKKRKEKEISKTGPLSTSTQVYFSWYNNQQIADALELLFSAEYRKKSSSTCSCVGYRCMWSFLENCNICKAKVLVNFLLISCDV